MATIAEVAEKVLQKLGVLESGATADSDDTAITTAKYNSVYGILAAQDLVSWGSADDIPTASVEPVVSIVADACLSEFIIPQDKQMIISRDSQRAYDQLRMIEHQDYIPEEEQAYYY